LTRAACTFGREGRVIGIINPTTGSLNVSNILFGGIIGIAVDAVSGATAEYEANVATRLTPAEFASVETRDRFFAQQRESFVAQAGRSRSGSRACAGRPTATGS
jgi:hypothetical protein